MIKKIRIKIIINRLKKYLKNFFMKLNYEEMTKVTFKELKNGEYLIKTVKGGYTAKLTCLSSEKFEFYINLFENEEVTETIIFELFALGKLKFKFDIKPKSYEIKRKTKRQVIDLTNRKIRLYLFRFKYERENNVFYEFNKPIMKSTVLDIKKLINVSRKAKKE